MPLPGKGRQKEVIELRLSLWYRAFMYFKLFIPYWNCIVLVSSIQQNDLVIHLHVSVIVQFLSFRLLQNIEQCSLCCTLGPRVYMSMTFVFRKRAMLVQYPVLFLPAHADLQLLKQVKTSLSPDPAVKCIENDT